MRQIGLTSANEEEKERRRMVAQIQQKYNNCPKYNPDMGAAF